MDTETAHTEETTEEHVETTEHHEEEKKTFADMTPEQVMSWLGRINKEQIAKQFDEKVLPIIDEMKAGRQVTDASPPTEDLQSLLFSSDPADHDKYYEIMSRRAASRTQTVMSSKQKELDSAILVYSEDPIYRDIHGDMKRIATEKMKEGWPPKAAAEHARTAAEALYLKGQTSEVEGDLSMLSGGGRPPGKKKVSLPQKLKAACQRDIDDGIVKDEADFVKNMSPKMRELYGL